MLIGCKLCKLILLSWSPCQFGGTFEKLLDNFELTLDNIVNNNPFMTVGLGDFNAKSWNWYRHDETSYKGAKIEALVY